MSKMEQLLQQWEELNNEVTELTCMSNIISYTLYNMSEQDEAAQKNIAGAASLLTRNINSMQERYMNLLDEIRSERDKT